MIIKIGSDPEFMVALRKSSERYIYPGLGVAGNNLDKEAETIRYGLLRLGADELGHCAEIRPCPATNPEDFVLNITKGIATLPKCFKYYAENTCRIDKKLLFGLIRRAGGKELSPSTNIYGKDILDDCEEDLKARKAGKRLLFCGCHIHLSATEIVEHRKGGKSTKSEVVRELPIELLVYLFDNLVFSTMEGDPEFNIGRYRSKGFYEEKPHGGFEYRSLGSTALQPNRMFLIAKIMLDVTEYVMEENREVMGLLLEGGKRKLLKSVEHMVKSEVEQLRQIDRIDRDLQKLWVNYL
jgi:hypothetical protein